MDSLPIKHGMRVTLKLNEWAEDGDERKLSLKSIVEDVLEDEGCLLIHAPIHKGGFFPFDESDSVDMCIYGKDSMHIMPVRYAGKTVRESLLFVKMLRLGNLQERQLRECFRLPTAQTVYLRFVDKDTQDLEPVVAEGRTVDISDGGMLFSNNEDFGAEQEVQISLEIDGEQLSLSSVVIRSNKSANLNYIHDTAVRFVDVPGGVQRRLYQYIMKKQLEQRRKERRPGISR